MLPFEDRYTRQRQLIEVGLEGQSRLQRSPFALALGDALSHDARVVALDYLHRAGVPVETNSSTHKPDTATSEPRTSCLAHFRFEGPAQVAAGALAALHHIRSVLGLGSSGRSSVDNPSSGQP